METLERRLQRRIHASLYALIFLTVLLGLSVLLESCTQNQKVMNGYNPAEQSAFTGNKSIDINYLVV